MQCCCRFRAESEPGGVRGVFLIGISLSSIIANPPSVVFSSAFRAAAVSIDAETVRKLRRERVELDGV